MSKVDLLSQVGSKVVYEGQEFVVTGDRYERDDDTGEEWMLAVLDPVEPSAVLTNPRTGVREFVYTVFADMATGEISWAE